MERELAISYLKNKLSRYQGARDSLADENASLVGRMEREKADHSDIINLLSTEVWRHASWGGLYFALYHRFSGFRTFISCVYRDEGYVYRFTPSKKPYEAGSPLLALVPPPWFFRRSTPVMPSSRIWSDMHLLLLMSSIKLRKKPPKTLRAWRRPRMPRSRAFR